jgi:hypothetical protein
MATAFLLRQLSRRKLVMSMLFFLILNRDAIHEHLEVIGLMAVAIAAKKTFPYLRKTRKTFDDFSPAECIELFRFEKPDLYRLQTALRIPPHFILSNRSVVSGEEALAIALLRLSSPSRWLLLIHIFGGSAGYQSECLYFVVLHIFDNFHEPLLRNIARYRPYIDQWCAEMAAVSPSEDCFGNIDGTGRKIAKPTRFQEAVYSGYKRYHCLKYHAVIVPCGLVISAFGAMEGRMSDSTMLHESGLLEVRRASPLAYFPPVRPCLQVHVYPLLL